MIQPISRPPLALPLAFFASGMAALLFQVLWFRALGRVLGNTVWAGTLVLTAFMLGMALGGLLAARWAQRIRRPAQAFATAEAVVALAGCALVWGLPVIEPLAGRWLSPLVEHSPLVAGARLLLALVAMLVPTIAMGITLALGVRILALQATVRSLGALYAANTFGACLAPLLAEYYLIGALGLRGTAIAAACLNVMAALVASTHGAAEESRGADTTGRAPAPHPKRLLLAAAAAGGLSLALEVIWFRLLILFEPGSDLIFALMLTLVLLGIAVGGAIAPWLARLPTAWIAAGSSMAVTTGYLLAGRFSNSGNPDLLHYAIPLILPPAVLSGSLFTLLGAQLRADARNPQPAIGLLTTANTLGAALGAGAAGLVLLPRLGMEASLFLLAAGYALLPLLLAKPARMALPVVVGVASLAAFPFGRIEAHLQAAAYPYANGADTKVVHVTQGPTTTFQLLRRDRFDEPLAWRLMTDGYSMTAIDRYAIRYMHLFAWLPYSLHPDPRRALLISYGAGNTAQALLDEPGLRELTVVDVSPEILAASPRVHGAADPLRDPRTRLVIEDGRQFLRTDPGRYDVITSEPPPPVIAGVVNLYTREYFEAVADRLAPGGLATYWLPVPQFEPDGAKAVTRAFCDVFADCTLWAGGQYDWILLGSRDFRHHPEASHFARLWRSEATARRLAASGLESPAQLGAAFLADAPQLRRWVGDAPLLVDDYPKRMLASLSFAWPRQEYASMLDAGGARRRFQESAWIAAHWPAELAAASIPHFAIQPALNGEFVPDPNRHLTAVDRILRDYDVQMPVMWLLGSQAKEQEIVERRVAKDGDRPEFAYARGVRALAERDFARAAAFFGTAATSGPAPIGPLRAYALCRAGRAEEAAAVPGADALAPSLRCWAKDKPA